MQKSDQKLKRGWTQSTVKLGRDIGKLKIYLAPKNSFKMTERQTDTLPTENSINQQTDRKRK